MVHKLDKARKTLADQQLKLKAMRTNKVKGQLSIETKVFKELNDIGVELSSYNGGSLNGKDIKKVRPTYLTVFPLYSRRGREVTACCRIRKLNHCVCIFVRCSFCGMEHFCWHGL
jgi:hypothetical protein